MLTSKTTQVLPLSYLKRFEVARVVELFGDECCVHRLEEIGIREGALVCMLNPGTPCIIGMEGRRISLRVDCDTEILVEPTGMTNTTTPEVGDITSVEC